MSDVRNWLESLDLGDYAALFEAEQIDRDALPHLTAEVLKELGIPTGPRLKMLAAIEAPAAPEAQSREAERRQITVMFCDLVGSTALSEKLDPEDLRSVMQEYQQAAGGVIERYGGHVAQYLGDGLMTYFGWPQAHEDDAERAVRASLDIVEAVGAMELQVRIGIATGPVVVGETGAGDASVPKLAVGETPNLAARLQGLAGADEIVVGASTRRLLGGTFDVIDLGDQVLKGIVEPVQAHRITGIAATEGRFEARTHYLTPLVGRDAEMAMVMARWEQAKEREGQVIVLSGEPGIGKSRITQALRERVADEPHTRLRYQCSPYHTNSALYPVIEQIERAAGFQRDDSPDQKLDNLEQLFPNGAGHALVASLLSLPVERYPVEVMSPQKQKQETLRVLAEQVVALATEQPVMLIFEDAHWIDPTSQELLDLLVPMVAGNSVLAVITHRPEYEAPWLGQGHVTPLALQRLGLADAAAMVAEVSDATLPDDVLDQIVARCDGVPLFVEELTKTVAEGGDARVPETLQDSLMARLDRLGPAKEIAQIGACIGREFGHELLAAVSPLKDEALDEALRQLAESELIHDRGEDHLFKHALVQDTAYESLLRSARQKWHEIIAECLVAGFPRVLAATPEIVAQHYTKAGNQAKAIEYWLISGLTAFGKFSFVEAISHLAAGLETLLTQEQGSDRDKVELDYRLPKGWAHTMANGFAAEETEREWAISAALSRRIGATAQEFVAVRGLVIVNWVRGDVATSEGYGRQLFALAKRSGNLVDMLWAETFYGIGCMLWMGRFTEALDHMNAALALYRKEEHAQLVYTEGFEPKVNLLGFQAMTYWCLGYPAKAMDVYEEAVSYAEELNYPLGRGFVRSLACFVPLQCGHPETGAWAREGYEYSKDQGVADWAGIALSMAGVVEMRSGQVEKGLATIVAGDKIRRGVGNTLMYWNAFLAEAELACGNVEQALDYVDSGLKRMEEGGEALNTPEFHRIRALALLERGDVDEAEASLRGAIDIAQGQSAKSWELRAATSLARLWQSQGKTTQACDLLAPVYGWFTEGFDTPDLIDAKALLDELEPGQ